TVADTTSWCNYVCCQSPKLVSSIRNDLAKPNAFVDISSDLISASAGPIDRCEPVTDCILGTNIHGDAHTTGYVTAVTVPAKDKAIVEFHSQGHVFSDTTGYNGPAVISSSLDTDFTATKRVELTDAAFTASGAGADATTCIQFHSVSK